MLIDNRALLQELDMEVYNLMDISGPVAVAVQIISGTGPSGDVMRSINEAVRYKVGATNKPKSPFSVNDLESVRERPEMHEEAEAIQLRFGEYGETLKAEYTDTHAQDEDIPRAGLPTTLSIPLFIYASQSKPEQEIPNIKKYAVTSPYFCRLWEAYTLTSLQGFSYELNQPVRIRSTTTHGLRGPYTVPNIIQGQSTRSKSPTGVRLIKEISSMSTSWSVSASSATYGIINKSYLGN
jgi:hypothetical protein